MVNIKEFSLCHVMFCITFIVSGLLINLLQLVLFLLLSKVNKTLYRRLNYYLVYSIYSQLLFLIDWWGPSTVNIYCQPEVFEQFEAEHALVLMNHHYELDWLYGWMMGDRSELLGNCRVYVKKMLQYIPVIGWCWRLSDVIFLERNWEKDKDNLAVQLNELLDYPSPVWILLFPEGTRFSQEKFAASKEFAASRGLPLFNHHLVPRTKGFSFTVSRLDAGRISSLYDVTLVAGGEGSAPPTFTSIMNGRSTIANMYIRRFDLKDIPKDEAGSSAWLMNLFKEKDMLKESFVKTGCFSQLSGFPKYTPLNQKPRIYSLILVVVLNCCIALPLVILLITGGLFTRLFVGVALLLAWFYMHRMVNMTKTSNSSAYGKKVVDDENKVVDDENKVVDDENKKKKED